MSSWIEGAFAKLGRAQEHYMTLNSEIQRFFEYGPDPIVIEVDYEGGRVDTYVEFRTPPDTVRWGLLVGDVCVNAMACLDYIAYALTEFSTNQSPPPGADSISFPITMEEKDWPSAKRGRIPDVRADLQAIIEDAQPFRPQPDSSLTYEDFARFHDMGWPEQVLVGPEHPLVHLRELVRRAKHRTLPVLITAVRYSTGGVSRYVRDTEPRRGIPVYAFMAVGQNLIPEVVEGRTKIGRFTFAVTGPDPEVDVHGAATFKVMIESDDPANRQEALVILGEILEFVHWKVLTPVSRRLRT